MVGGANDPEPHHHYYYCIYVQSLSKSKPRMKHGRCCYSDLSILVFDEECWANVIEHSSVAHARNQFDNLIVGTIRADVHVPIDFIRQ